MKGMAEEFPIEAEAEQDPRSDVTRNGEITRQYMHRQGWQQWHCLCQDL